MAWQLESFIIQPSSEVKIQIVFICKYYNLRISFSSTLQFFDKEKLFDRPRNIQFLPFIVLLRIKSIQTQLTRNILLLFFLLHFSFTTFITTQGLISFHHIFFLDDIPPQSKSIWKRLQTIHVWIISMLGFLLSITFFFILCFVFFVVYRDFKNFFWLCSKIVILVVTYSLFVFFEEREQFL